MPTPYHTSVQCVIPEVGLPQENCHHLSWQLATFITNPQSQVCSGPMHLKNSYLAQGCHHVTLGRSMS